MSFNLSSKMKGCTCGNCVCMRGNDVKEFIRLLKERLKANEVHTEITYDMVEDYIDELAGEELCNG